MRTLRIVHSKEAKQAAVWPLFCPAGLEIKLVVYRTPVKAGSCYVFYNNITRGGSPQIRAKLAAYKKSPLETHLSMLRFFVSVKLRRVFKRKQQQAVVLQARGWASMREVLKRDTCAAPSC
jgi:hypothetical protein